MAEPAKWTRVASLKTAVEFRRYLAELGATMPCDDQILREPDSPLLQPLEGVRINGKTLRNRFAVQPMEGWDGTTTGGATDEVRRRWRRFGESGASLICGGEAMAVRPDGRANPHQLVISRDNLRDLAELTEIARQGHREVTAASEPPIIGFQLTHSGRFCKPTDHARLEPRVAFRHPILDRRFGVTRDDQVFADAELELLVLDYVKAARSAWEAGADFVDIKHCHGYLLHEFLSAHSRPGPYGGPFENRTRLLREIVSEIRRDGNPIDLAVRLSAFDLVPFRPDPNRSEPGKPGPGVPEPFDDLLPYQYAFGVNEAHPVEPDLSEALQFADLCVELGIKILNLTAGSPYYNPHVQRPAAYPPSDGYLPPEDPLLGVARQVNAVRQVRAHLRRRHTMGEVAPNPFGSPAAAPMECPLVVVGSAYSYLQEFLPQVAQAVVREGWTDLVGMGRMVLSYPAVFMDALKQGRLNTKALCRTFSDCTTAPRNGMVSGCYPLDRFYSTRSEAQQLKAMKKER